MWGSVRKADLLSANFNSKQSSDPADLPSSFHSALGLVLLSVRSLEVMQLLLDMDSCGGTDALGMFPICLRESKNEARDSPLN